MNDNIVLSISLRDIGILFGVWTGTMVGSLLWLTKQFKETRHYLSGGMNVRYSALDEKIDLEIGKLDTKIDKNYSLLDVRVKDIELRNARQNGTHKT